MRSCPKARAACQDACLANFNTVQGDNALVNLTTGFSNTAFGANTLLSVTSATGNTAVGVDALYHDTTGYVDTAIGEFSLFGNTTGIANRAVGAGALEVNTTGFNNTAIGQSALQDSNGNNNTAAGYNALFFSTTGSNNTAVGSSAMGGNPDIQMTGSNNTATGATTLLNNTTGFNNTATGYQALGGNTTGSFNIALGVSAGGNLTTGKNNIDIGNAGVAGESNKIRIGTTGIQKATFIAGISGVTVPSGVGVIVGTDGKLGTVVSSERYKDGIQPMDRASEAILALKPVTFRYKHELDPAGIPQFGLVAEQVEKVDPELVARDAQGKPYTVRYEAVNAMLLNEFLKAHRRIEEQHCRAKEQEATIAQLKQDFQSKLGCWLGESKRPA